MAEGETDEEGHGPSARTSVVTSQDPSAHLNYASILFYKGRRLLQSGDHEGSEAVFKEVEQELLLAARLSDNDTEDLRRRLLKSQCAFLLGDVYLFVFKDRQKAKAAYQDSLGHFPEHDGAREALKRFE